MRLGGERGAFTQGKVVCVEADHSPASNAEVAEVCKCTLNTPRCSTASSLIERDNFGFTFTFREKKWGIVE